MAQVLLGSSCIPCRRRGLVLLWLSVEVTCVDGEGPDKVSFVGIPDDGGIGVAEE